MHFKRALTKYLLLLFKKEGKTHKNRKVQIMLSNSMLKKDIAKIVNHLQVPLVVADIVNGKDTLTDDMVFSLHDALSDAEPDSALLSIALSTLTIANVHKETAASFRMLKSECERIINDYGMMWLRNAQNEQLDADIIFETLLYIPEDFESLSELLDIARIILQNSDSKAAELCKILITQANAQSLIAQTVIDGMEAAHEKPWNMPIYADENIDMSTVIAAESYVEPFYADNVIAFPKVRN